MRGTVRVLVVGGLALALAHAFAQRSREEVRAEAASAARAGQIDRGEVTREPVMPSVRTRLEVKAESRAAVKAGTIARGEAAAAPPPPATSASSDAGKSRAEVRAEAASALGMMRKPETPSEAARK